VSEVKWNEGITKFAIGVTEEGRIPQAAPARTGKNVLGSAAEDCDRSVN
jgi:hypothetical protein